MQYHNNVTTITKRKHIIREPDKRAQYKPQHTYIVKVLPKDIAGRRVSQKPSKKKIHAISPVITARNAVFIIEKGILVMYLENQRLENGSMS